MKYRFIPLLLWLISYPTLAIDDVTTSGFLTTGAITADGENKAGEEVVYLGQLGKKTNYLYLTKAGVNFTADVGKDWLAALQILTVDASKPTDHMNLKMDWAFLSYRPFDGVDISVGKQKIPVWLISDYIDIGILYPWPVPPKEVYKLHAFKTFTGVSGSYSHDIAGLTTTATVQTGTSTSARSEGNATAYMVADSFVGYNLALSNDWLTIRASKSEFAKTEGRVVIRTDDGEIVIPVNVGYSFLSHGVKLEKHNILALLEYAVMEMDEMEEHKAWYITLGYGIGSCLPYGTVSKGKYQYNHDSGLSPKHTNEVTSTAIGLKHYLTDMSDIKIEVERKTLETTAKDNEIPRTFSSPLDGPMNIATITFDVAF